MGSGRVQRTIPLARMGECDWEAIRVTSAAVPFGAALAVQRTRWLVSERPANERELVLAAQGGQRTAFSELVRMHERRAYAVARAIVVNHEDAEDAVQDGFLHAYRALDRFLPDQAFGAWLHRIVANAALDITRRRKVRDADELPETVASPFRDPAEGSELRRRLNEALETLPARQRAVIVLHDVEGFKHSEIGQLLGIPEGTARSDLHYARSQLRGILGPVRRDL
ncbi:MAG: sigma-70 family RNA polymerase sigma factor [Betaproteobacteria bacterium]|nr:sigma-70 family RNA polymerase sigma factor [Betaproteobacteria bacterium]